MAQPLTLILPLWGEKYVALWRDISLPSFLAPGNLPALARRFDDIKFRIYTSAEDWPAIEAAKAELYPFCQVEAYCIGPRSGIAAACDTGTMMTKLHQMGYVEAFCEKRGILYLVGDSLFSDGLYETVGRHIESGVDAVVTQGTGIREETARLLAPNYHDMHVTHVNPQLLHDVYSINIPPRDLVRMTLDDCLGRNFVTWDMKPFVAQPANINWLLRDEKQALAGMLMRWFHVFPLYINPLKPARIQWSIDNDLLEQVTTPERCAWITDSDDGLFVDMYQPGKTSPHDAIAPPAEASIDYMVRWCQHWTRSFGRAAFKRPILLRGDSAINVLALSAKEQSDGIADEIARRFGE